MTLVVHLKRRKKCRFVSDVEKFVHKVNTHDPCVTNKHAENKHHTLTWNVDDINDSHVNPDVNTSFGVWCENQHGSKELGHAKITMGKMHEYLGMTLDYSKKKKLKVA